MKHSGLQRKELATRNAQPPKSVLLVRLNTAIEENAKIMVLRYFGIRVTELERSLKFYTELLGLKKSREGTMKHGGKWVLLEDPRSHQRLELNWYPPDSPYSTHYVAGEGLDHIGFKVQNAASTAKRLISKGADPILFPKDKDGINGLYYLKDPDGNWIEFF